MSTDEVNGLCHLVAYAAEKMEEDFVEASEERRKARCFANQIL